MSPASSLSSVDLPAPLLPVMIVARLGSSFRIDAAQDRRDAEVLAQANGLDHGLQHHSACIARLLSGLSEAPHSTQKLASVRILFPHCGQ